MNSRVLFTAFLLTLGACAFEPDLTRFDPCNEAGQCPAGFLCLAEAHRCVPECGENCPAPSDGGADAGVDAGVDAGFDAGVDAGEEDAGFDAGFDAGQTDAGPQLALAGMTLPPAIETKTYSVTFAPTGGVTPYTFLIDGGVPGLTLNFDGVLGPGAPTTPGTFPFSITARDSATPNAQVTTNYSLEVRPLLRVASNVLVEGRQGQAYFQALNATGGQPPYTWVIDGGMPPGGVILDGGALQGAPNATTTVMFGVTVSDSATPPQSASRVLTVQTRLLDLVLAIATVGAPDGRVGTPYSLPLKAYGGSPAYTWSIQPGSSALPPGLTLMNAGSNWAISGTPTDAGTYPFTLHCVDAVLGSANSAISITIY